MGSNSRPPEGGLEYLSGGDYISGEQKKLAELLLTEEFP